MMIELIECGCSDEREKKSDKEIEELCKVFGHAVVHMFHFVMVFSIPATLTYQHYREHLFANTKKTERQQQQQQQQKTSDFENVCIN